MIYDINKGYGLQLTKFDEQYQDTIRVLEKYFDV